MYKSKLQEVCVKYFEYTPKYNTMRIGGQDHSPKWKCKLTVPNGIQVTKKSTGSKKKIENVVAKEALNKLEKEMGGKSQVQYEEKRHIKEIQKNTNQDSLSANALNSFENKSNICKYKDLSSIPIVKLEKKKMSRSHPKLLQSISDSLFDFDDLKDSNVKPVNDLTSEPFKSPKSIPINFPYIEKENTCESSPSPFVLPFPSISRSSFTSSPSIDEQDFMIPPKVVLFIDIENRGDIKYFLPSLFPRTQIHGFVANHYDLNQVESLEEYCQMHIIPSTRKDAADIGIMIEGTKQVIESNLKNLWILSNDKFAETWKEIMTQSFPNLKVKIFPTISHLKKHFMI
jgi:hypothetical protein